MLLDRSQLFASLLAVLVTAVACGAIVLGPRAIRRGCAFVLCACALLSTASWFRFGALHSLSVDVDPGAVAPTRAKVEKHLPLQFHEFFHYYLGAKYFRELGYLGLYDCTTLADLEIAEEEKIPPLVTGFVRDLDDVLTDKTRAQALESCRITWRPRFTAERWDAFEHDLRELHHLVSDSAWNEVVFDAGFNPPPSTVMVYAALANAIPIRAGPVLTCLLATSFDVALLVACFFALRAAFGIMTATVAAVYFGTSYLACYGWLGGAFLRFFWVAALVFSLAAMKRERWVLAGALLGAAVCDRLFPVGFLVGAAIPLGYRATRDAAARKRLVQLGIGSAGTIAALVLTSCLVLGPSVWSVFFARTLRYGDIYYVMHVGLKKVLTFRDWVPWHDFHGHDGLIAFHDWNVRLRETWDRMRLVALAIQALAVVGTTLAAARRKPHEAAVLAGVVFMFSFSLPASYYYVVLFLVPAVFFRAAATAPSLRRRRLELAALLAFDVLWMVTLLSPSVWNDDIVYDFVICVTFALFLAAWMVVWMTASRARIPTAIA